MKVEKILTMNEKTILDYMLKNNGCGARSTVDLIEDNYSYQSIADLKNVIEGFNKHQLGGVLSSMLQKGILSLDERDDDCDLFFINDTWLETHKTLTW